MVPVENDDVESSLEFVYVFYLRMFVVTLRVI